MLCPSLIAQVENIALVTTTGEATVKVKPDHAVLGLRVKKKINTSLSNDNMGFEIFDDEDTRVRLFDFDDKNIVESIIQVDNTTYIKEIFITVRDLDKLDRHILELRKQGFKRFFYFDYRSSNLKKHKEEATQKAMLNAQKKAQQMAKALQQNIGKAHTIDELETTTYNWYELNDTENIEDITYLSGSENYLVEPGYIVVIAKVKVSFDLVKK